MADTCTRPRGARSFGNPAVAGLALAAALTLIAAGCHSASHPRSTAQGPPSSTSLGPTAQGTLPPGVSNAEGVPTDVPNDPALRQQVQLTSCQRTASGWQAGGTATGAPGKAGTYTVTVFFTTASATVIGFGSTQVAVRPGAPNSWAVSAAFTAAADTRCVLRGVG